MYQVNIVVQWQDGHYEEFRGQGDDWKGGNDNALEQATKSSVAKKQEYRLLSEREWRELPKPISVNNWVPKKPIPLPGTEVKPVEKLPASSCLKNWNTLRVR